MNTPVAMSRPVDSVDIIDIIDIDIVDIVDSLDYLREEELPVLLGDDGLDQLGVGGVGGPPRPHQLHLQQGYCRSNGRDVDLIISLLRN